MDGWIIIIFITQLPSFMSSLLVTLLTLLPPCRSPGGTPVRRRRSKGVSAALGDPAALIAEALKKKFAHRLHDVSSDKENSLELSPFGSPETPKVDVSDAPFFFSARRPQFEVPVQSVSQFMNTILLFQVPLNNRRSRGRLQL